jgi:hypothetical protein
MLLGTLFLRRLNPLISFRMKDFFYVVEKWADLE